MTLGEAFLFKLKTSFPKKIQKEWEWEWEWQLSSDSSASMLAVTPGNDRIGQYIPLYPVKPQTNKILPGGIYIYSTFRSSPTRTFWSQKQTKNETLMHFTSKNSILHNIYPCLPVSAILRLLRKVGLRSQDLRPPGIEASFQI